MKKIIALESCATCLTLLLAQQALAQSPAPAQESSPPSAETGKLVDIIVTAQKRSENLQKVPIAITAVSPKALENAGITSMQALPAAVPGLQLLRIGSALTPRVRGVGSTYTAPGVEAPVATFVDDVYRPFGADLGVDFQDVQQVALLKGPQGTLFGRNATGGVVQITTRQPSLDFGGSIETSLDNYLTSRSNLFVTGGLSDNVAASLSVSYMTQGRGWGQNLATGHDTYKTNHDVTVRGKIRTTVGDRTTINFIGDYTSRAGPIGANFRTFPGYSSILPTPQGNSAWDSSRFVDSATNFDGGGISMKAEHEFDFGTLTSISGYRHGKGLFSFTNVPSSTPTLVINLDDRSTQFTQEVQLVSPSGARLSWAIGAFYFYNLAEQNFVVNNYGSFAAVFQQIMTPARQKTNSIAGFAQATYRITDDTRLTAGIRYTRDDKDFTARTSALRATGTTAVLVNPGPQSYSFSKPTWRIALDHDFAPQIMGYISYNRGVKSGGFNTRSPANPPFQPERLDAYEAGLKTQLLDNRIRFNVGGFYYDYKNIQVIVYLANSGIIINGAAARSYGIDSDLEFRPTDNLIINASANWLHARFTDFKNAPSATPNAGNQGATLTRIDASGFVMPYSPSFTYTLGMTYDIPTSNGNFALNVTDSYNSGFYTEVDEILHQGSYHFLNASVGWTSSDDRLNLRFYVNNILNKAVVSQGATAPNGYIADYSNPPRIAGASLKVRF